MNKKIFALILGLILFSSVAFAALSLVAYWTDNQNSALTIEDGEDAQFYSHFFTTMPPVEYSVKLYEGSTTIYTFENRLINSYDYWNYYVVDENRYADPGNYRVEIRAEDNGGSISFESLTLTVEEAEEECPDADNDNVCDDDEIPFTSVVANANPSSGVEPLTVAFTCNAQGGNTPLTYRWTFGDGGTSQSQNPSHTYVNDGYYTATCTAYDSDNDFRSGQVSVTVNPVSGVNQPPVIQGIPDKSVNEDTTPVNNWIDLWQYASDNEDTDSELSFSIQSQSNSALISCSVVSDRYIDCNTPSLNGNGYSDVVVKVVDTSGYSDTDTFRVAVTSINDAPVIDDIGDQTARVGSIFRLDVDASDVDNNILYFRDDSPLFGIDLLTGEIEFTPSRDDVGTHTIQICVSDLDDAVPEWSDNSEHQDCDTFELTIRSRIGDDGDDDEEETRTEVTRTNCVDDGDGDKYGTYLEITRTFEDDRFVREDVNERSCLLTDIGEDGFIVNVSGREDEEEKQDLFIVFITALIFVVVMLLLIVLIHRLFTRNAR